MQILFAQGGGMEVGAGAVIAGIGTIILPTIFNGVRAILADRAKAKRDNDQTELFRKMHEEQINTRIALIETSTRGNERWSAFQETNRDHHQETLQAIKGSCHFKNKETP